MTNCLLLYNMKTKALKNLRLYSNVMKVLYILEFRN